MMILVIFGFGTLERLMFLAKSRLPHWLSERGELIGSAVDDRMGRSARPAIPGAQRTAQ